MPSIWKSHAPRRGAALAGMYLVLATAPGHAQTTAGTSPRDRPVIIAVIGEAGANLLHQDFQLGHAPEGLPANAPSGPSVPLPSLGSFTDRVRAAEAGPLGAIKPNVLYHVRNNRVAGVINPTATAAAPSMNLFADTEHGTGVVSAIASRRFGTDPEARLVLVLGAGDAAWQWAADQPWIDIVSASYLYVAPSVGEPSTQVLCPIARQAARLATRGALAVVANGNDPGASSFPPASLPGVYHTGGVAADGRPVIVDAADSLEVTANVGPDRPYDSGELFSFPSAADNSVTGTTSFGGTSGAAPRLAGDAAVLLAYARRLVGDRGAQTARGVLAHGSSHIADGPLTDGVLTLAELQQLLRHTAQPALGLGAPAFPLEGYGATTPATQALALSVLSGRTSLQARPEEDQQSATAESVRRSWWQARCSTPL